MAGVEHRPDLGLDRQRRLESTLDFKRIRETGERAVRGSLIANWLRKPDSTLSRLGVVTSKKIGHSVIRSRARRLLRETFRMHQHELIVPIDLVLVARNSIAQKNCSGVERDYLALLKEAGLIKKERAQ